MNTIQLPQQPNGANGSGGNGHAVIVCPRRKKQFASRQEAEQFEAANRERFGNQYAYECPDCPYFHLTSKPPESFAMGQSNLKRLGGSATSEVVTTAAIRKPKGETEAEVKCLWEQEKSDKEIALALGITLPAAGFHRRKFGRANGRGTRKSALRQPKPPLTLADVDERQRKLEQEYQAQLQELERQKERLAEATKLTVCECQDGKALYIKFGHHERMSIPKDKAVGLADSLMKWL